jgi:hypothetical protein
MIWLRKPKPTKGCTANRGGEGRGGAKEEDEEEKEEENLSL